MWSKILGKVTGIIKTVADFPPQLGGLISLVKSMISVGLSAEELQATLKMTGALATWVQEGYLNQETGEASPMPIRFVRGARTFNGTVQPKVGGKWRTSAETPDP